MRPMWLYRGDHEAAEACNVDVELDWLTDQAPVPAAPDVSGVIALAAGSTGTYGHDLRAVARRALALP